MNGMNDSGAFEGLVLSDVFQACLDDSDNCFFFSFF